MVLLSIAMTAGKSLLTMTKLLWRLVTVSLTVVLWVAGSILALAKKVPLAQGSFTNKAGGSRKSCAQTD